LTGCSNRRAFFERFETEFELSVRENLSLSVMMVDIDHFKSINDDFGHGVGDDVIRQIADVLKSESRANDCVGRYGGEEFCVILVAADVEAAKEVGERARIEFARRMQRPDSATAGRPVTASFGVSTLTSGAADVAKLLDQADQALYESKNNGRNRVTVWRSSGAENQEAS
jgi:diguanylate cyclase (GGDEF)-like protein